MLGIAVVLNTLMITTYGHVVTGWAATFLLYVEFVTVTCHVMLYPIFNP